MYSNAQIEYEGEEWGMQSWDRSVPELTDFDLIVVDMRHVDDIGAYALQELRGEIAERVAAGAVLLCLLDTPQPLEVPGSPEISNFAWVPVDLHPRARSGTEHTIVGGTVFEPLLKWYLSGRATPFGVNWTCDLE